MIKCCFQNTSEKQDWKSVFIKFHFCIDRMIILVSQQAVPPTFCNKIAPMIFMYWASENHTFNATPTERLQQHSSFFQQTAPIARSFCEGGTWHHLHMLVKAPLCCDWKGTAASAQTFTLWHQATVKIPRRVNFISACSRHMGVVHHAHPVRGESSHIQHNANWEPATLAERSG